MGGNPTPEIPPELLTRAQYVAAGVTTNEWDQDLIIELVRQAYQEGRYEGYDAGYDDAW